MNVEKLVTQQLQPIQSGKLLGDVDLTPSISLKIIKIMKNCKTPRVTSTYISNKAKRVNEFLTSCISSFKVWGLHKQYFLWWSK